MFKKYAYKIVKGELTFNNSADAEKIDELINEWNNAVIQYANMFVKIQRFIEIQTKLPENFKKTAKEYAEQLVKQNGKQCIFTDLQKSNEMKKNKAIKHLERKKIVEINSNFIKLE